MQRTDQEKEIRKVVGLYIDGFKGRKESFVKAFHPDAWIFFTNEDGHFDRGLLTERFDAWSSRNWDIDGEIVSVTQLGDVANVVLKFNNQTDPSASYVDFLNLIYVTGEWRITNKTATHQNRI